MLMALLQPAPEVYHLFDDILLLCEGKHCPRPSGFIRLRHYRMQIASRNARAQSMHGNTG